MLDEKLPARIVEEVIARLEAGEAAGSGETGACEACRDITAKACRDITMLDHPQDAEALARMKKKTTARIGVGRAGPRLHTPPLLPLRGGPAQAPGAGFRGGAGGLIEKLGLFTVQTKCAEKNQFLPRPDRGRQLSEEGARAVKERCAPNPDVQVFLADGLSSTAVEANAETILGLLLDALKDRDLTVGTPFFVRFGRVAVEDQVAELVGAKVVCVLIGERPGLGSAESMSAYIAYNARVGMPEARRTVVSNIHKDGISAAEAGAYIAELIEKIYHAKASGVELQQ